MTLRWLPDTEQELVEAIADGRLDEGQHLDFKKQLDTGKKANAELARDIAMFANDGGSLIFGVAETGPGAFAPAPVLLDGFRERVEQVAASRLDPPLHVGVRAIPAEEDETRGYVIVTVPASARAPHMADGRYWGRAGSTRTILSDTQVRAVLASREAAHRSIVEVLERDIERDPIPEDMRQHAHLYLVARPRFSRPDLVFADVERAGGWSTWFHKELLAGAFVPGFGAWAPDLKNQASSVGRRADGAALYSYYMGQDGRARALLADEDQRRLSEGDLLDVEVNEDGTVHLFSGRGSDTQRLVGEVVIPAVVAGLTLRGVQVARRIAELTSYQGPWDLALGLTGLEAASAHAPHFGQSSPLYSQGTFEASTTADTVELLAAEIDVAERLVGRLLRGLSRDDGIRGALQLPR